MVTNESLQKAQANERLEMLREAQSRLDSYEEERLAINEDIKSSELGKKRKEVNAKTKRIRAAIRDIVNGEGDYNPNEFTITAYIDAVEAGEIDLKEEDDEDDEYVSDEERSA